tara:strand:- start:476 stop:688 length:213 start_codon:yes stop_codon:yes gene_type:complete
VPYWDWAEDTDICKAKGGCATFHEESNILQTFGGPGNKDCMTHRGSENKIVPTTEKSTALECAGKTTFGR